MKDKVVIITGGSSGIGKALAEVFGLNGSQVLITGRNLGELNEAISELAKKGINYKRQVSLPIFYDGLEFDEGLRIDVLVDEIIICELKAVDEVNVLWQAQIMSHLKLTKNNIGFLINFNVPLIKNGIRRFCIE